MREFAEIATHAARSPKTKKFHDDRAYIASVYRNRGPALKALSKAEFADALVRAHRAAHLRLTRADLVSAMPKKLVADSEIAYGNHARFHFVAL